VLFVLPESLDVIESLGLKSLKEKADEKTEMAG